jgi:Ca2+-dependent lipid-binding protein
MENEKQNEQHKRYISNGHPADKYAPILADQVDKLHEKKDAHKHDKAPEGAKEEKKGPAGGFDSTPIPRAAPGYTLKFTFHRATNLPFADLNSLSSDPFIVATLNTDLQKRHKQDPDMKFRTPTIRRNTSPEWNCDWIVAHVPASGFFLKCRIYDEDPADHDDRLGNVHVRASGIGEQWSGIHKQPYKIKKRMGSKRAYMFRWCAAMFSKDIQMSGEVFISVESLGRSEGNGGRTYTIGPQYWTKHYSPLIGRLTGTKNSSATNGDGSKTTKYK